MVLLEKLRLGSKDVMLVAISRERIQAGAKRPRGSEVSLKSTRSDLSTGNVGQGEGCKIHKYGVRITA